MTVKELIEMLKTCDEGSIVYIDYNGDINIGKKYAIEKAKDQIWSGLGFVLQWAINGLKKK